MQKVVMGDIGHRSVIIGQELRQDASIQSRGMDVGHRSVIIGQELREDVGAGRVENGGGRVSPQEQPEDDVFDYDPGFQEDPNQPFTESDVDDNDDDGSSANDNSFAEDDPDRIGTLSMAQFSTSVPINVPQFKGVQQHLQQMQRERKQQDLHDGTDPSAMRPDDMARSIQALARSVHADSAMVFGDLPKSRTRTSRTLSTQSSVSGEK
jgi:hypothetical protein